MAIVRIERGAEALNLTSRRVPRLASEGMPREGRSQYDPVKCMLFTSATFSGSLRKNRAPAATEKSTVSGPSASEVSKLIAK